MKIKKQQLNKELQSSFVPTMIIAWLGSKVWGIRLMQFLIGFRKGKSIPELHNAECTIPSRNGGPDIRLRIYRPLNAEGNLPVMLYVHGGGYVFGCPEIFGDYIKRFIDTRPCILVCPDYRKALEAPFPAGFDDCYDTLLWIKDNARALGAKVDKLIIAGHSAGGGMTAALTWKARDTGDINVGFQMPIYPMIDDSHTTQSAQDMIAPLWGSPNNKLAWSLYLKGYNHDASRPHYATPAKNTDYRGFPPTITFVGDLEPFRDETIAYVEALRKDGVTVEFELFEGCYHGFDLMETTVSKQARDFTFNRFAEYYDRYIDTN